ncbi:ATP-dependent DNA helicase srs2 [Podospora aff. communis PSN243]|uniref:DNA 3'-5' helicase n=1 Tax=Podospora aff. communis PSN243 TaxID=3040156 RepID=A0AAV9G8H5_9PEZI|nr:ATP-dependent DNA helicase srs2 [Podospora aff. communis PSN243]
MAVSSRQHAILESLNDAQRRAVSSTAATVAILAGPGSGKTHTLTSRVVWLIDHVGYRPEDVVVATFTVKAAREMKERIGRALGDGRENKIVLGTFHSIARRYLAAYGRQIGLAPKFGIADDSDSRNIITRICKRLQLTLDPPAARAWISKKKAGGTEGQSKKTTKLSAGLQELQTCYDEYQKQLKVSNLLDYDDLLVRCVELLRKFPSCVSNVQTVLIDEYQDTNSIQYELMKLFAQQHRRITVVGDPDQSIYGWRSAEIQNLWRLLREFPGTAEVSLEENYRSSQSILGLSLAVIQQDKNRYKKVLKPVHSKGSRPVLRRLKSGTAEADWIVSEIRRTMLMTGNMLVHSDVAILLRSAALSRHIESALGKAGIPYRMIGGFKFYDRAEIKTLLDYLRVIHRPENNDALGRIMNVPRRGIGEGTIKNLIEEAEKSSMSLWTLLSKHCRGDRTAKTKIAKHAEQRISGNLLKILNGLRKQISDAASARAATPFSLVDLIQQLLKALDFEKYLQDSNPEDHEQRWANVQEFVNLASDFSRDLGQEGDDTLPEIDGVDQVTEADVLPRFLANVALASDAQTGNKQEDKPLVTISTIHAAKGLEWPVVFVPAVYNGSIPHAKSEDNDEERRLLYVAMTRAQCLLYLSCPSYSSNGHGERNELSCFVNPLSAAFAKKGPCLDRPVVEQIARIVQRPLPSQKAIFGSLPPMYCTEDNLFPIDPDEARQERNSRSISLGGGPSTDAPPCKRPRLSGPGASHELSREPEFRRDYTTTMEQSSSFTFSLPGFVSAGAHREAVDAANAALEAKAKEDRARKMRATNQQSILGFVQSSAAPARGGMNAAVGSVATTKGTTAGPGRPTQVAARPNGHPRPSQFVAQRMNPANTHKPAMNPELSGHTLGAGKVPTRPEQRNQRVEPVKHYTVFSSSPQRPPSPQKPNQPADADQGDENEPPPEPTRPAACYHVTTCTMPLGLGGLDGLKRPAGLGIKRIEPMAKLTRPFKPPTMNRPR